MALTTTDVPGAIASKGGSVLRVQERLSTGANLGTPDTVHDLGDIENSGFRDKTPYTPRYNEAGDKKSRI